MVAFQSRAIVALHGRAIVALHGRAIVALQSRAIVALQSRAIIAPGCTQSAARSSVVSLPACAGTRSSRRFVAMAHRSFGRSALAIATAIVLTAGIAAAPARSTQAAGTLTIGVVADLTGQG